MTLIQAAFLGILQGLTEFLPVSSSGHLCLAQHFLGLESPFLVSFDICLHLASLLAILVVFAPRIQAAFSTERSLLVYLFLATLPTVFVGLFWAKDILGLFDQPRVVAVALFVTGVFLFLGDCLSEETLDTKNMGIVNCLLIGLAQATALTPGISRSGMTISSALICSLKRKDAFEFSFLMAIPAILGAAGYECLSLQADEWDIPPAALLTGMILSFLFSLASLFLLRKILISRHLKWLGIYCFAAGAGALILMEQGIQA